MSASPLRSREAPTLEIEAPESLRSAAERLRRVDVAALAAIGELVGLRDPGLPIRVVLAPEGSPLALEAPSWASGYAYPATGVVVLIPEREISYPDDSLEGLLRHELAHVMVARAAGGNEVPRWFDEGVATIAGSSWGVGDRARLTLAVLLGGPDSLAGLDRAFRGDRRQAAAAYALSGAFVRDLIQGRGRPVVGSILRLRSQGRSFSRAFRRAAGMTLARAEEEFWSRRTLWNRWVPLLTSSVSLWLGITLLALLAIRRRRARDARIQAGWDEEETVPEDSPVVPNEDS